MSNRNYASGGKIYSMNVKPVMVDCSIVIGASGAVASFSGAMIQSVTRTGTGLYDIKLQANTNFRTSLHQSGSMISPASGESEIMAIEIANDPTTKARTASGAVISIKAIDQGGGLADPALGSTIQVLAIFNDSAIKTQA